MADTRDMREEIASLFEKVADSLERATSRYSWGDKREQDRGEMLEQIGHSLERLLREGAEILRPDQSA